MYFHTGTVYTAFYLLSNDILPITKSSHPNRLTLLIQLPCDTRCDESYRSKECQKAFGLCIRL